MEYKATIPNWRNELQHSALTLKVSIPNENHNCRALITEANGSVILSTCSLPMKEKEEVLVSKK